MQQLPTQKPEPNTKTKNMDLPKMPHNRDVNAVKNIHNKALEDLII